MSRCPRDTYKELMMHYVRKKASILFENENL